MASKGLRLVVVSNVDSFLTSSSWEPTPGKTDFTNRSKGVVLSTTRSAPVEPDAMRVACPVRGRLVGVTLGFENNPNILSHVFAQKGERATETNLVSRKPFSLRDL